MLPNPLMSTGTKTSEASGAGQPEVATQAARSHTVFPYDSPTRFQFTLSQDNARREN